MKNSVLYVVHNLSLYPNKKKKNKKTKNKEKQNKKSVYYNKISETNKMGLNFPSLSLAEKCLKQTCKNEEKKKQKLLEFLSYIYLKR